MRGRAKLRGDTQEETEKGKTLGETEKQVGEEGPACFLTLDLNQGLKDKKETCELETHGENDNGISFLDLYFDLAPYAPGSPGSFCPFLMVPH